MPVEKPGAVAPDARSSPWFPQSSRPRDSVFDLSIDRLNLHPLGTLPQNTGQHVPFGTRIVAIASLPSDHRRTPLPIFGGSEPVKSQEYAAFFQPAIFAKRDRKLNEARARRMAAW